MSLILEERESIIRDNNTAQGVLSDIIKDINPDVVELNIKTQLFGDVDLSICSKLTKLRTIMFGEGKITSIRNVPGKLLRLACSENLLVEFDDLPNSLTHLECGNNFLTVIDFSKLPHLEELHCNDNRIDDLGTLSKSLVAVYCQNNDLKYLDLKGMTKLRTLNISNNPLVIVENLPDTIHEYIAENNQIPASHEEKAETNVRRKIDYVDALKRFFKMKTEYETELRAKKRKAFSKGVSKKEGTKLAAGIKAKCVSCKRPVGTVFSTDVNGYTAICGDANKPCNLDIKLTRGNFELNETILSTFANAMNDTKSRIIQLKMDTLFSYVTETTSSKLFNRKIEEFNKDSKIYKEELDRYNELYNSAHKKQMVLDKLDKIYKINQNIRLMLEEYENNKGVLQTVVSIYKNDLQPELENLRRLKYDVVEMTYIESDSKPTISVLNQLEVATSNLEYVYGEQPSVVKFNI